VVEMMISDVRVLSGRRRTPQGESERAEKGPFRSCLFSGFPALSCPSTTPLLPLAATCATRNTWTYSGAA
jgi:hypothetical protein